MKKKLFLTLSVIFALSTLTSVTSASTFGIYPKGSGSNVNVYVNETLTQQEVPARVVNNRTMVPLRGIFEALGAQVQWDNQTRSIIATKDSTTIELHLNSTTAVVNGQDVTLDVPPMIINGRTMVPIHFVSDALGAHVSWDSTTDSVFVHLHPLPTMKAMYNYITSMDSNYKAFWAANTSINNAVHDYANNNLSFTDFKAKYDAQLKIMKDTLNATKALPISDDATVKQFAQATFQLWEQMITVQSDKENIIHADHLDNTDALNKETAQNQLDLSAYHAEYFN